LGDQKKRAGGGVTKKKEITKRLLVKKRVENEPALLSPLVIKVRRSNTPEEGKGRSGAPSSKTNS